MSPLPRRVLRERDVMLRAEVERLAQRSFDDEGWEFFVDKEVGEDELFSFPLVERMLENLPYYDAVSRRPPSRRIPSRARSEARGAYEEALAWFASRRPSFSVDRFRQSVIGEDLVPPRRARRWLDGLLEAEGRERELSHSYWKLVSLPVDSMVPLMEVPIVELRNPVDSRDYWAPVMPGESDADWLRRVARNRAADVGCSNGEAALWVISGRLPSVEMIRTVYHPPAPSSAFGERIELTVDPATPPHEVMAAYSQARAEVVGKRTRLPTPKHPRLAIFADQRPTETWAESMRRWNDANPDWRYTYVPNFWRDCDRALRRFTERRPFSRGQE